MTHLWNLRLLEKLKLYTSVKFTIIREIKFVNNQVIFLKKLPKCKLSLFIHSFVYLLSHYISQICWSNGRLGNPGGLLKKNYFISMSLLSVEIAKEEVSISDMSLSWQRKMYKRTSTNIQQLLKYSSGMVPFTSLFIDQK